MSTYDNLVLKGKIEGVLMLLKKKYKTPKIA